jgi:hypothetical protein
MLNLRGGTRKPLLQLAPLFGTDHSVARISLKRSQKLMRRRKAWKMRLMAQKTL